LASKALTHGLKTQPCCKALALEVPLCEPQRLRRLHSCRALVS